MTRLISTVALILLFASVSFGAEKLSKAEKAEQTRAQADQAVKKALFAEIYGDQSERDSILKNASKKYPEFAPAKWHQGLIKSKNTWKNHQSIVQDNLRNVSIKRYEAKRNATNLDSIDAQMELANWCAKKRLPNQEKAHLLSIINLEPDHAEARQRLGFFQINGQWLNDEDLNERIKQAELDQQSLAKWQAGLLKLVTKLSKGNRIEQNGALAELRKISDPSSLYALEMVVSPSSEFACNEVIKVIAAMGGEKAAESLARHAIFAPWESVRDNAAVSLRSFDRMFYVPEILDALETPTRSVRWVVPGANGQLVYRHALLVETKDENQMVVEDVVYRRRARFGGDRGETTRRMLSDLNQSIERTNMLAQMRTLTTEQRNNRLIETLNATTAANAGDDPREWWSWWNQENEIYVPQKATQVVYNSRVEVYEDIPRPQISGPSGIGAPQISVGPQLSGDCLLAGTMIQTAMGLKAVDKMLVGDMVLSKNPETGELAYKSVVQTTVRPESNLVQIGIGNDSISASGGHPFWVSGEGWVKAREVKEGMLIHTASGFTKVESVSSGATAKTYNMIVEDFHTYFVGKSGILSHDNTLRGANKHVVPGVKH